MLFPCVKVNLRGIGKCFSGIQKSVTFTITGRIKMIRACRLLNQYCIARISKKIQKNFPKFDGICRQINSISVSMMEEAKDKEISLRKMSKSVEEGDRR